MIEDIKIINQVATGGCHISINTGTLRKQFQVNLKDKSSYLFDGYIPKDDWKVLSSNCLVLLSNAVQNIHFNQYIRISSLPEEITLKSLEVLKKIRDYNDDIKNILCKKYINQILNFLYERFLMCGVPNYLGLRVLDNLALPTITFNKDINSYIGLHVDCWDSNYINNANCRNRICVNLGAGPRFFYFINLSIEKISDLYKSNSTLKKTHKKEIAAYFLDKESSYPVIRVTLNPGEYYVAPTERIIHDASFRDEKDTTITILGYFR